METKQRTMIGNWLLVIAGLIIIAFVFFELGKAYSELKIADTIVTPDTSYSRVTLDSIQINIGKHDTTIYKLNLKLKDDVEKSYLLTDSDAVALFQSLLSGKSE